jgi:hypothetical protein
MANEDNSLLVELVQQIEREFLCVLDKLLDDHFASIADHAIRLPRSALIPVDYDEQFLKGFCIPPVERELGRSGPTVKKEDDRIISIRRPFQNPLIIAADTHFFENGNRLRRIALPGEAYVRRAGRKQEPQDKDQENQCKNCYHDATFGDCESLFTPGPVAFHRRSSPVQLRMRRPMRDSFDNFRRHVHVLQRYRAGIVNTVYRLSRAICNGIRFQFDSRPARYPHLAAAGENDNCLLITFR